MNTSKKLACYLLAFAVAVLSWPATGSDSSPARRNSHFTGEQWSAIKNHHPNSNLCETEEVALWTCRGMFENYSSCASQVITPTLGHVQYRAGRGATTFQFPSRKRHPLGLFEYRSSPNGDAAMTFHNDGYDYTLFDRLSENSSIRVSERHADDGFTEVSCGNANKSLQLNYTIKLMRWAGI